MRDERTPKDVCREASFKWAWIKVLRSLLEVLAFKTRVFKSVFITANLLCSCQIFFLVVVKWTNWVVEKEAEKLQAWPGIKPWPLAWWPDAKIKPEFFQVLFQWLRLFILLRKSCSLSYSSKYIHLAFPYTIKIYCEKVGFAATLSYVNVVKDYFSLSVMFWKMH